MQIPRPRILRKFRQRYFFLFLVFLARTLLGRFLTLTPTVYCFNSDDNSQLIRRLRSVNTTMPTKACRVMSKYGSDKGRLGHNYTTVYSALFGAYHNKPLRIFELGLGTNNPDLPSNMGVTGRPGASLRGWRELFPQAFVYGADIDRTILFHEDKIKTFFCNQLDQDSIRELWNLPDLQDGVDILIEDGLHTLEANISFLEGSLEHLRPGGIYVVEDITTDNIPKWRVLLETVYSRRYPDCEFALTILPNVVDSENNNILIIQRKIPSD